MLISVKQVAECSGITLVFIKILRPFLSYVSPTLVNLNYMYQACEMHIFQPLARKL